MFKALVATILLLAASGPESLARFQFAVNRIVNFNVMAQTITGITLSGTTFNSNTPSASVGNIAVQLNNGSFVGNLALTNVGSDVNGNPCSSTNSANFVISGTQLLTNSSGLPFAAYPGVCITATQSGANPSTRTVAFNLTATQPTPSISSLTIDNTSVQASTPNAVVGNLTTTLTQGSATPTYSVISTGQDHSGTACNTATGNFVINGSKLQTNSNGIASGLYNAVCVQAAQSGVTNSPYIQAFNITATGLTISSITLSNTTFLANTSNTNIGLIGVTLSNSAPFTGALSIVSSGTDVNGIPCTSTNGTNFQLSGSQLQTNGSVAAGTYPGVCIQANQNSGQATSIQAFTLVGNSAPANSITLSNSSGSPITNYPFQFGRPFLQGAVTSGHCPTVFVNGTLTTSQADIKNSYPDGSVEFAVMAVVISTLPTSGSTTITFGSGSCSNTPLSQAAMLGSPYNFDAAIAYTSNAKLISSSTNNQTLGTWTAITNGGFTFTLNGTPHTITGLNFSGITIVGDKYGDGVVSVVNPALKAAGLLVQLNWYAVNNVSVNKVYWSLTSTGFTGTETITTLSAPGGGATDISSLLGMCASCGATAANGQVQTIHARNMLSNNNYSTWTSGGVAQTIELVDNTATRAYDVGFGDGFHPIRPRFFATFWPTTGQVAVNAVSECCLASELEDTYYKFSVIAGNGAPTVIYNGDLSGTQASNQKYHWMSTAWNKRFWLSSTPSPQVNIDFNTSYLEYTRFIPSYDLTLPVASSGAIVNWYNLWNSRLHDIYDGTWDGGLINSNMGAPGAIYDIGPYPTWTALWLYSQGDWRARAFTYNLTDASANFPMHVRESVTGKRMLRSDTVGTSTGLGHVISVADRRSIWAQCCGQDSGFAMGNGFTDPPDAATYVGPATPFTQFKYVLDHEPQYLLPQYVNSGDRWWLEEMYAWGSAGEIFTAPSGASNGRGPSRAEGGIAGGQVRAQIWGLAHRADAAFAAADADPEKTYFIQLENDALARIYGGRGMTGTVYDGTGEYNWGASVGPYESGPPPNNPGAGPISPIGAFSATDDFNGGNDGVADSIYRAGAGLSVDGVCNNCTINGTTLTVGTYTQINRPLNSFDQTVQGAGVHPDSQPLYPGGCSGSACTLNYSSNVSSPTTFQITTGTNLIGRQSTGTWQEGYLAAVLARISEEGFAGVEPLRKQQIGFYINIINSPTTNPKMITNYRGPLASFTNWFSVTDIPTVLTTGYYTCSNFVPAISGQMCLNDYFQSKLYNEGYTLYPNGGIAYSVSKGDAGATQMWSWYQTNVRVPIAAIPESGAGSNSLLDNPKWYFAPSTSPVTLPAFSTTTFQSTGPSS